MVGGFTDPQGGRVGLGALLVNSVLQKDFHHWCSQKHPKPGEAWMWGGSGGVARRFPIPIDHFGRAGRSDYPAGFHPAATASASVQNQRSPRAVRTVVRR